MRNTAKKILAEICEYHSHEVTFTEAKEAIEALEELTVDFNFEFNGNEYRIIHEDDIFSIYAEEIEELIKDCYLGGTEIPAFVSIDWEKTAENCLVDGYGHHFSGYDGSETEADGYYIFRTN